MQDKTTFDNYSMYKYSTEYYCNLNNISETLRILTIGKYLRRYVMTI